MPTTLKASEHKLREVFSDQFVYRIPPYQRPYSWTRDQTGELLQDLQSAMEDKGHEIESLEPYFLGSIVLVKSDDKPDGDVVDGQQRLTTLTMLLATLRRVIEGGKGELLRERLYEEADEFAGKQARFRLSLRQRDNSFFKKYVQTAENDSGLSMINEATLDDSQQLIRANMLFLWEKVRAMRDEDRHRLAAFLLQRCYMVVVSASDPSSAYRLFRVLNDRGLDLSDADVLKAEILGKVPAAQEDEYVEKWEDLEADLGREEFEALFGHIRAIRVKEKLRKSLLEEVREHVRPASDPVGFIDGTLVPLGELLLVINQASYQSSVGAEAVNHVLRRLQEIDNRDWVPVALSYLVSAPRSATEIAGFLLDLERLAAGLMISSQYRNERVARYAKVLKAIEDNPNDVAAIRTSLDLGKAEKDNILAILSGDLYLRGKVCQYVLRRLDEALSGGAATYSNALTVEHVLPQNPPPNSVWAKWFTEDNHQLWVHRIGNLVLLSRRKNSEASNLDFAAKLDKYFRSAKGVAVTATVTTALSHAEWTPAIVETRQREFIKTLTDLWRLS
jgi:hypothetical protein